MNKLPLGLAAISFLETAEALQLNQKREPLLAWSAPATKSPHPVDYAVANFGKDEEILGNNEDLKWAETNLNHTWTVKAAGKPPPMNYPVANFGKDEDVVDTLSNLGQVEAGLNHKWVVPPKGSGGPPPPINYAVPNFGKDKDVLTTNEDLAWAESKVGHKWDWVDPRAGPPGPPVNYAVPNFGKDEDIIDSMKNEALASQTLGHVWNAPPPVGGPPPPVNYAVANFGKDKEILATQEDLKWAEAKLGQTWEYKDPKAPGPPAPPMNYAVPNFGKDEDVISTLKNEALASVQLNHTWVAPAIKSTTPPPPMNYAVTNFGKDKDIINTDVDLKWAENKLGHKWDWVDPRSAPAGPPKNYAVPNFGVDKDIVDSLKHLDEQEKIHGEWQLPEEAVQLDSDIKREPLFTWRPKPLKSHPTDYFVPNYGKDQEIITSQNNEKAAEGRLEHDWTLTKDKNDNWVVPSPQIEFKLLQTDSQVQREPLLTWAPTIAKPDHPMNYFVPNFGKDENDVLDTQSSWEIEENRLEHKWRPTPKSAQPKPHPTNYFVPNFGVDQDIVDSISHLKAIEANNGVWHMAQAGSEESLDVQLADQEPHQPSHKLVKDQSKIDAKLAKIQNEETANKK